MLSLATDFNQATHEVSLDIVRFDDKKQKYKEEIMKNIIVAACAMLNSNGGKVVINIQGCNDISVSQMSSLVRRIEQNLITIIGTNITEYVNCEEEEKTITMFVDKADSLITINYNLYLPSKTQVNQILPSESQDRIKEILSRRVVEEPVQCESHRKFFSKGKGCGFSETKTIQLKNVKAETSKRTTLADRMTGKDNKFSCYISAFANHKGGHIYYGIDDDGVVVGERIPDELDGSKITMKVEKVINKMIWPELPKQKVNWDIFFEPVLDENSMPVTSTFVIVIFIAPCFGGVFTEEPECYEMVEEKIAKMSFDRWKEGILQPIELFRLPKTDSTVKRSTWSSSKTEKICNRADELLLATINGGKSIDILSKNLVKRNPNMVEVRLLILAKKVMASYRSYSFEEAREMLGEYDASLRTATEFWIFDAIRVYLKTVIHLTSYQGDVEAVNNVLREILAQAEVISPGRISAALYLLAAMHNFGHKSIENNLPVILSTRALEHVKHMQDLPKIRVDLEQKAHIILAFFYLGCNRFGVPIKKEIDHQCFRKADCSIKAIRQSIDDGNLMNPYREVHFNLVQSVFFYRRSQLQSNSKMLLLKAAFDTCKKTETLAIARNFQDVVNCSRSCMALFTECLIRTNLQIMNHSRLLINASSVTP